MRIARRATAVLGAAMLIGSGLMAAPPARADNFTPTTTTELEAAVADANTNDEADIIDLGGNTFTLNDTLIVQPDGGNELTFVGPGTLHGDFSHTVLFVAEDATVRLVGVTVAGGSGTGDGGGVANSGTLVGISSEIIGNNASGGGAGIANSGTGTVNLSGSAVSSNSALGGAGGGILNVGEVTMALTEVSANTATGGGAGIHNERTVEIDRSLISNNAAVGPPTFGGGIHNLGSGSVRLESSTVSTNSAERGGGIAQSSTAPVFMTSSTVTENTADVEGGGLHGASIVAPFVEASIVAGNQAPAGADCGGSMNSDGFNVVGPGGGCPTDGTDDIEADPLLGPLLDNGGSTFTHLIDPASPAVDRHPDFDVDCPGLDQRDVSRPQAFDCDSGAVELIEVSISDIKRKEGNRGRRNFPFKLSLGSRAFGFESVDYATVRDTAKRNDFVPSSGTLTFGFAQDGDRIVVGVRGDRRPERPERFFLELSNPHGVVLVDDRGKATIRNDDRRVSSVPRPGGPAVRIRP